ncbi:DUF5606 domain-containing protein [Bacteroidales bacterium OttesenSCG-928-I14]|nr:DUF5606 domain-containing protein [Bacteroidales bacterium OttesenSCG-928-I14]
MLKEILSVSGKPGLFKLISQGKNMFIAESLIDKKRIPVYARDKVVSLNDIAIYTDEDDVLLGEIFNKIYTSAEGKEIPVPATPKELFAYFETVLPNFDKDRVYPTDIKKLIAWYNLLTKNGFTDFSKKEIEETVEGENNKEDKE